MDQQEILTKGCEMAMGHYRELAQTKDKYIALLVTVLAAVGALIVNRHIPESAFIALALATQAFLIRYTKIDLRYLAAWYAWRAAEVRLNRQSAAAKGAPVLLLASDLEQILNPWGSSRLRKIESNAYLFVMVCFVLGGATYGIWHLPLPAGVRWLLLAFYAVFNALAFTKIAQKTKACRRAAKRLLENALANS